MVKKKEVINYQQLTTIDGGQDRSTIINNYQQLSKIAKGQERSTINNSYQQLTEDKIGQPLSTINNNFFRSFSRDYCDSQCEHCEQPN